MYVRFFLNQKNYEHESQFHTVPAGMAGIYLTGTLAGTETRLFRVGKYTGPYRVISAIPEKISDFGR